MANSDSNPVQVFTNLSRHKHELRRLEGLDTYTCGGCKEFGEHVGYKCNSSAPCQSFILHEACATLPDVYSDQRLGCELKFHRKIHLERQCNACGHFLEGFVFETKWLFGRQYRLHPLCMITPQKLEYAEHPEHLLMMDTTDQPACTCTECHEQIRAGCWRYSCTKCHVNVDLSCSQKAIHGISVARVANQKPHGGSMGKISAVGGFVAQAGVSLVVGTAANLAAASISNAM